VHSVVLDNVSLEVLLLRVDRVSFQQILKELQAGVFGNTLSVVVRDYLIPVSEWLNFDFAMPTALVRVLVPEQIGVAMRASLCSDDAVALILGIMIC